VTQVGLTEAPLRPLRRPSGREPAVLHCEETPSAPVRRSGPIACALL